MTNLVTILLDIYYQSFIEQRISDIHILLKIMSHENGLSLF